VACAPSIRGDLRHDGGGLAETNLGYCGLGNVVSSLGLATTSPIEVDSVVRPPLSTMSLCRYPLMSVLARAPHLGPSPAT
jgi:hypothetical protein